MIFLIYKSQYTNISVNFLEHQHYFQKHNNTLFKEVANAFHILLTVFHSKIQRR